MGVTHGALGRPRLVPWNLLLSLSESVFPASRTPLFTPLQLHRPKPIQASGPLLMPFPLSGRPFP